MNVCLALGSKWWRVQTCWHESRKSNWTALCWHPNEQCRIHPCVASAAAHGQALPAVTTASLKARLHEAVPQIRANGDDVDGIANARAQLVGVSAIELLVFKLLAQRGDGSGRRTAARNKR